MCTGTMTLRPVSVWHVLPRAQLQSSRRAFATARRRRPGGSHLPGRATRTMRGRVSFAAAAASTAALGARRDGPARGTASPARHPKDAWPRARLGYRRRRTTGKVAAAASDDVLDEGKSVTLSVVPRVAARRAPLDDPLAPLHPRTARSFSSHIFFFFPSFSDVSSDGDDDASTQRPIRTRARARRGGADDSSALPLARASRDDETPSRSHETASGRFSIRVGHLFSETLRERLFDARDAFPTAFTSRYSTLTPSRRTRVTHACTTHTTTHT
jgi:hypothetical protein